MIARRYGGHHHGEDGDSDVELERHSKRRCDVTLYCTTRHDTDFAHSKTSPTQPGRGIRKIVDLYHDLTVLLIKARKQSVTNALDREALKEMDRSDFRGMTEEEIEEERKEYVMRHVKRLAFHGLPITPAANGATLP
jgi:hypothetical protein